MYNKEKHYDLLDITKKCLSKAEQDQYFGWDKMDAMNSKFLKVITFNNKYLKIIYTQIINRFPYNLRRIFGVAKQFNPKAGGLVISSLCKMKQITGEELYIERAYNVLKLLIEFKAKRREYCWGYGHEWQSTAFHRDKYEPNAVATLFVAFGLCDLYKITKDDSLLDMVESVNKALLLYFPVLVETDNERAISYIEIEHSGVILNIQSLYAIFLIRYSQLFSDNDSLSLAKKHLNYVVSKKTEYHAWYYSDPPSKSHITHDNYHTGYILDSLYEYYNHTKDGEIFDVFNHGLSFYKENLFTEKFEPKWMYDTLYPMDVHSAAQGIISFTKAGDFDVSNVVFAEKLLNWVVNNLYDTNNSDFFYQKHHLKIYKHKLFRWNDAWMMYALTSYLLKKMEISTA